MYQRGIILGAVAITLAMPAAAQPNTTAIEAQAEALVHDTTHTFRLIDPLIYGLYGLINNPSKYPMLTGYAVDSKVSLVGYGGYQVASIKSRRYLNLLDKDELKREVFHNIELQRAIKITYGNGGGRKILMWSAVDCPACVSHEQIMRQTAGDQNVTFYVIPTALDRTDPAKRALVTNIWCSKDNAAAWENWMLHHQMPKGPYRPHCDVQYLDSEAFLEAIEMAGVRLVATPTFIYEDGYVNNRWEPSRPFVPQDSLYTVSVTNRFLPPAPQPVSAGFLSLF